MTICLRIVLLLAISFGMMLPASGETGLKQAITITDRTGKVTLARLYGTEMSPRAWRAPHFVLLALDEAARAVCGGKPTCRDWQQGGFRIHTTLRWDLQKHAEALLRKNIRARGPLTRAGIANGALAALDYRRGEILAYTGSADFWGQPSSRFTPEFDVLSHARRQAGSTFKPFVYLPGLETGSFDPATLLLDASTEFELGYRPSNHDGLERGPVRLRDALAYSLNIPAVKAAAIVGTQAIYEIIDRHGLSLSEAERDPGAAVALGVFSVRPIELLSAYGSFANGGERMPRTAILSISSPNGEELGILREGAVQATTRLAAFLLSDMLSHETTKSTNPYWGRFAVTDARGQRIPAALKTGTSDGARDLWTVGFLPPPEEESGMAIAALLWLGNSDGSATSGGTAQEVAAPLWHRFMQGAAKRMELAHEFPRPPGLVRKTIDAISGFAPGPWTHRTFKEWFPVAVEPPPDPTKKQSRLEDGLEWVWDAAAIPTERPAWRADTLNWVRRASGQSSSAQTNVLPFFNSRYQPYGEGWGRARMPATRS